MAINLNPLAAVRSRPAFFIAAALLAVMLFGLLGAFHSSEPPPNVRSYTNQIPEPPSSLVRSVPPVTRLPGYPDVITEAAKPEKPQPLFSIHVELPPDTTPPPLSVYAPVGRLVQCQLVMAVDSGANDTPVIALVTADLWHDGKLVVPAGSEAHGRAQVDTLRDRVIATGIWTIVKQNGEELLVTGIALDRQCNEKTGNWGVTDGSPGLSGTVIRSQSLEEIKLFAATMLSGVASGFQQYQTTALGAQVGDTLRNAPLAGASQVMTTYAQQILDTIKKQGVFVRVPAGKQFYLYVTQTIDMSQSKIGNLRATTRPLPATNTPPVVKP